MIYGNGEILVPEFILLEQLHQFWVSKIRCLKETPNALFILKLWSSLQLLPTVTLVNGALASNVFLDCKWCYFHGRRNYHGW
jgi:hypothetical protein